MSSKSFSVQHSYVTQEGIQNITLIR